MIWADIRRPEKDDAAVLLETFRIDELPATRALEAVQYPKVESYGAYIYVVLHGIDFKPQEHAFETQDVDFFLARNFLVTVHDGRRRSIDEIAEMCGGNHFVLADGPVGLMHRIVDTMVAHYRPEVDELEEWLDDLETRVVQRAPGELTAEILAIKRDISAMRRIVIPQRDVIGRLARREFDMVGQGHAYRFRDVYDHLVQIGDETIIFQDRVSGILDAHLAATSNQLALVSKVLAGIAVIFGPLTVITGIFGMNVELPVLPGGPAAQFWWIVGLMGSVTTFVYWFFRHKDWL
jgi:magnesium transporter